jgi:hypothetical protein
VFRVELNLSVAHHLRPGVASTAVPPGAVDGAGSVYVRGYINHWVLKLAAGP